MKQHSHQRFVSAIITNKLGQVLLYQRDRNEKKYPNSWTLFGGKVHQEESFVQGLERVLKLDLNLNPEQVEKIWLFHSHNEHDGTYLLEVYLIHTVAELEDLVLGRGRDFDYFRTDQLLEIDLAHPVKSILMQYCKIA